MQLWGLFFLILLFIVAILCCLAIFMFKGTMGGTWSKHKRSRAYIKVASDTATDNSEVMLSGDPVSPRSPVLTPPRNQPVSNSPTPAPQAFLRSPVPPQSRGVLVPTVRLQSPRQVRLQSQAGATVMVRTSVPQLTSQQHRGQRQITLATSQRPLQVQRQQSPPRRQVGDSNSPVDSLFEAIDQNHDGVISRSEFNRAYAASPLLVGSASTPVVSSTSTASEQIAVAGSSPSTVMATPGALPRAASPFAIRINHGRLP